ncbi:hypothetical protein LI094_03195 [[Clostridium] saccharogumia]|uniref:hypothetical protein n=1 Tax=Thomasclavelia saccharogumia TaxID=341225 RepID=UPI001D08265F|nr:hypothetical protein [Thomasclavelia saccharogumia]MCB6705540.1 hypothetical protein [Thomasclavelia saccharogumia]
MRSIRSTMLKLMILISIYLHQKNIQLDINIDKYNERNSEILPRDDETATSIPKPEFSAENTVLPHRLVEAHPVRLKAIQKI